ncbi:hypothetical protein NDU88_011723, partial [Pleurodeles waltl]
APPTHGARTRQTPGNRILPEPSLRFQLLCLSNTKPLLRLTELEPGSLLETGFLPDAKPRTGLQALEPLVSLSLFCRDNMRTLPCSLLDLLWTITVFQEKLFTMIQIQ